MFKKDKKERNMRKIFQWKEYLNWKELSPNQKINLKRALLFPFLAYFVYSFLTEFTFSILIILAIYFFIKFRNKNKLSK
tara:strand:+ start:221 stop:457 length:237 start_codon:yes stop_codon:yes gene_type:complete